MFYAILLAIIALVSQFFSAQPADELIQTSHSPDNSYVLRAYRGDGGGGATTANHIRCNLENVREHSFSDIYYCYRQDEVEINWIDSKTVNISGKVLDVTKDSYDSRDEEDDLDFWLNYWELD